jgi:hypothetical protein
MPEHLLATLSQFGAAGLIGVLWLIERRQAAHRERQLDEAHRQVVSRERELDSLLRVVQENTRAINSLQLSQKRLLNFLARRSSAERAEPRATSSGPA